MNNDLIGIAAFSTTRRISSIPPIPNGASGAKIEKILRLPLHSLSKGDGGLRTTGRFKCASGAVDGAIPAPLVTVVTVTFNAARLLEQTILSVINQSYPNVEFIIVDGGSQDGTLDILRKYEHAIDYWVSEPDNGIFDAWNKGVSLCSGDWVAFLGADDIYLDGALDAYAAAIEKNDIGSLDYISSRVNLIDGDKIVRVIGGRWNWRSFSKYMNVAHVGSLHNVRLFQKWNNFDLNYRICGDYELLLRPGPDLRADYFEQITVNMSIGGVSDANWRALLEMTRAKVHTGGRNIVLCYVEFGIAIIKWHIRRVLWY